MIANRRLPRSENCTSRCSRALPPGSDFLPTFDVIADRRSNHRDYRMLEDPSYSEIVRWGDEGDSFVVLEVMRITGDPVVHPIGDLQADLDVAVKWL